ncbi:MAG TPA: DR2241 family protein [Candidatus Limnocylindria bacterium]|nr:DR2241 family protein [Candidatus Limnocylindria bacterium]
MASFDNPAVGAFIEWIGTQRVFGEVLIRASDSSFTLCHVANTDCDPNSLEMVEVAGLRALAANTERGDFRPLKSAPNLRHGWKSTVSDPGELETAFSHLYPGSIADWYAVSHSQPHITGFREFVDRQTGMFRTAALLNDASASEAIRATCDKRVCVKRRLWTIDGLEQDPIGLKSAIPCLEPCAMALEFARRAMRLEQDEKNTLRVSLGDLSTLTAAIDLALAHPDLNVREGDSGHPANPRRILLLREKLLPYLPVPKPEPE